MMSSSTGYYDNKFSDHDHHNSPSRRASRSRERHPQNCSRERGDSVSSSSSTSSLQSFSSRSTCSRSRKIKRKDRRKRSSSKRKQSKERRRKHRRRKERRQHDRKKRSYDTADDDSMSSSSRDNKKSRRHSKQRKKRKHSRDRNKNHGEGSKSVDNGGINHDGDHSDLNTNPSRVDGGGSVLRNATQRLGPTTAAGTVKSNNNDKNLLDTTCKSEKNPPQPSQKQKGPMTHQQYQKLQNEIHEFVDPHTGRTRWMRGTGEIVERIVTREEHLSLNQSATLGDGLGFSRDIARLAMMNNKKG